MRDPAPDLLLLDTLGAARFVSKPVDPSMLLQIIREVMEERGHAG